MLILTLRTDKPEAEIGLYEDGKQQAYVTWEAHRQLAETLHAKIKELLESQNINFDALDGIVAYRGPGSFTGLRIGLSVANALADSLAVPIVGAGDKGWQATGIQALVAGQNDRQVVPEYYNDFFTTKPVK